MPLVEKEGKVTFSGEILCVGTRTENLKFDAETTAGKESVLGTFDEEKRKGKLFDLHNGNRGEEAARTKSN